MDRKLTRREMLKGLGLATAGAVLASCKPQAAEETAVAEKPVEVEKAATTAPEWQGEIFRFSVVNESESRRPVVDQFIAENYPGMETDYVITAFSQYWEKLTAQLAAGDPPDLAYMHESRLRNFARLGALLSIDEHLTTRPLIGGSDQYPLEMFEPITMYEGKRYAMPVGFAVVMMKYNKTMFEEAGLKLPSPDWTVEEWRNSLAALTKDTNGDGEIDQWGWTGWSGSLWSWWWLMRAYGAWHFNPELTECIINNKEGVQALEMMRSTWCGDLKSSPARAALGQLEAGGAQLFEAGVSGAAFHLSQHTRRVLEDVGDRFEAGIEVYPAGPNGYWLRAGGTSWAIPAGSKHPDIAWELTRHATGDEEANKQAAAYEEGNPLIRKDWVLKYNVPEGPLNEDQARIIQDCYEGHGCTLQYSDIGEYQRITEDNFDLMSACEVSAQEAADSIAEQANQMLSEID